MFNSCNFIGRLGKDPETKTFNSGDKVCNFSVAVSESWKDKATGKKQERTEWVQVITRNKLAEVCQQYLCKGKQVYVQGKVQLRTWEKGDKNGAVLELHCDVMKMLGDKEEGSAKAAKTKAAPDNSSFGGTPYDTTGTQNNFTSDDIPF